MHLEPSFWDDGHRGTFRGSNLATLTAESKRVHAASTCLDDAHPCMHRALDPCIRKYHKVGAETIQIELVRAALGACLFPQKNKDICIAGAAFFMVPYQVDYQVDYPNLILPLVRSRICRSLAEQAWQRCCLALTDLVVPPTTLQPSTLKCPAQRPENPKAYKITLWAKTLKLNTLILSSPHALISAKTLNSQ